MAIAPDKRQFGRRAVSIAAVADVPPRASVPCAVLNLSDGGALLRPLDGSALPASFQLRLEDTNAPIPCEVAHTRDGTYGISFKFTGAYGDDRARRAIRAAQQVKFKPL